MKKLFLFLAMASTTMFVSCGSDDSDSSTGGGATSITLTTSAAEIPVGGTATLTVKDNTGATLTGSTFVITPATGAAITGSTFTGTTAGSYSVVAKNGSLTSAAVTIKVTAPAAGKFTFAGTDYSLDNMFFVGHGDSTAGQFYLIDNDESEEGEELGTLWIGVLFNGEEADIADATHYMEFQFFLPAIDNGDGTYGVNFPGDVAAVPYSIYAEENLEPFAITGITAAGVTFDAFELPAAAGEVGTTENSSVFSNGTSDVFTHEFNGNFSGIYLNDLSGSADARGVKKSGRSIKASQLVKFNNVKRIAKK